MVLCEICQSNTIYFIFYVMFTLVDQIKLFWLYGFFYKMQQFTAVSLEHQLKIFPPI